MGKIEEGGANVGSMYPVTPVDQVLSKTMTAESVDAEFNALLLTNKNETPVDPEQVPELPADIPPAEDPMNPIPENPNERPATTEEIKSVSDLEAEMEAFFGDMNIGGELYTEGVHTDMAEEWKKYFKKFNSSIKKAKSFLKSKKYNKAIDSAKEASDIMKTCKKKIQSIHPDLLESILGLIIRDLIYTMELILTSMITLGFGGFVVTVKEWVTRLTGLFETYKKMGAVVDGI